MGRPAAPGPARPALTARLRARHATAPLASAAGLYAALAAVRIAGAYWVLVMVVSIALSLAVLVAVPREEWARVGVRRFAARPALSGVGLVVAAYAVSTAGTRLAFGRGHHNWTKLLPDLFTGPVPGARWLDGAAMVVSMGVLVPLVEEICYRGVLFDAVARARGPLTAAVVTSAGWALVHLGDYGLRPYDPRVICGVLPSVFLMGLALAHCRLRTGSALASALAQGAANLLLLAWVLWWL